MDRVHGCESAAQGVSLVQDLRGTHPVCVEARRVLRRLLTDVGMERRDA